MLATLDTLMTGVVLWDVDPVLLRLDLGSWLLELRYYSLLFAVSLFLGHLILAQMFAREGDSAVAAARLTYWLLLGVVLGARLAHVFFYQWEHFLRFPVEIPQLWKGGLASHGAALGLLVVGWRHARRRGVPWRVISDRMALMVLPALIAVRLGNLFNSEVYGRATEAPWGFVFARVEFAGMVARHPTQLYEALNGVLVSAVLLGALWYHRRRDLRRPLGLLTGLLLAVYFTVRFFLEFTKEYIALTPDSALTVGQWLSIPFALVGWVWVWRCARGPWRHEFVEDYVAAERAVSEARSRRRARADGPGEVSDAAPTTSATGASGGASGVSTEEGERDDG